MSYLANPHRPYDSPDPPAYSHAQLAPQNARNVLNMPSFDALSAQHSAPSPDQRLPKLGETRCCQYLSCTIDHSLFIYPRLCRFSSALCTSPLTHYLDWTLLSADLNFVYLDPVLIDKVEVCGEQSPI